MLQCGSGYRSNTAKGVEGKAELERAIRALMLRCHGDRDDPQKMARQRARRFNGQHPLTRGEHEAIREDQRKTGKGSAQIETGLSLLVLFRSSLLIISNR